VNPVDAARVLGLLALEPDLYLLGPAGAYVSARFGTSGAALLLMASLGFWTIAPLAASIWRFRLPGTRARLLSRPLRVRSSGSPSSVRSAPPVSIIKTEEVPSS
jgi:hypothetical protein